VNGGAQGFFRIGNDRKTNLLFGGEVLGGIGVRGITQLELAALPRVPVMLRTEVTNEPAGVSISKSPDGKITSTGQGEVGVRTIAQVGYRLVPRLVLAVRGSFSSSNHQSRRPWWRRSGDLRMVTSTKAHLLPMLAFVLSSVLALVPRVARADDDTPSASLPSIPAATARDPVEAPRVHHAPYSLAPANVALEIALRGGYEARSFASGGPAVGLTTSYSF
jgi:hypothetical protein